MNIAKALRAINPLIIGSNPSGPSLTNPSVLHRSLRILTTIPKHQPDLTSNLDQSKRARQLKTMNSLLIGGDILMADIPRIDILRIERRIFKQSSLLG